MVYYVRFTLILWNKEVHKYSVFQTHTFWKLQGPPALNYVNQHVQKKGPKLLALVPRIPKMYNT